jgi:hypothetical protein
MPLVFVPTANQPTEGSVSILKPGAHDFPQFLVEAIATFAGMHGQPTSLPIFVLHRQTPAGLMLLLSLLLLLLSLLRPGSVGLPLELPPTAPNRHPGHACG